MSTPEPDTQLVLENAADHFTAANLGRGKVENSSLIFANSPTLLDNSSARRGWTGGTSRPSSSGPKGAACWSAAKPPN